MSPHKKLAATFLKIAILLALISLACNFTGVTREVVGSRDWYVATDGDDANSCETSAAPCLTINAAIDKATDLDVVHIAAGFYINERYSTSRALNIDKNIILQGAGLTETFINGHGTHDVIYISNATVTIVGLTIRNGNAGIQVAGSPGIEGADNLVLIDSRLVRNNRGLVINAESSALVQGSRIVRNTNTGILNAGNLNLRNSYLASNGSSGISLFNSSGVSAASITNTNFDGNEIGISTCSPSCPSTVQVSGSVFTNNEYGIYVNDSELNITNSTFSANQYGIRGSGNDLQLSFVTVFNNSSLGVFQTLESIVSLKNSLIANNGQDCSMSGTDRFIAVMIGTNIDTDGTCSSSRTLSLPELLIDGALAPNGGLTWNHALLPGSPAIDPAVGCPASSPVIDQRGASRPYGDGCDIGAYEFDPTFGSTTMSLEDEELDLITVTPSQQDDSAPTSTPTPQTGFQPPLVSLDTLCWTGPGKQYSVVSTVTQGTEVELLGSGETKGWWVIDNPRYPGVACWLPEDKLDVDPNLDLSTLKVFPVPPLPTATVTPAPQPVAPNAPSSLAAAELKCNTNDGYVVKLTWKDNAGNESGYRVYRGGSLIATLGPNATQYSDTPPGSGPYSYQVEAFNNAGTAKSNTAQEDGCIY